jgi:hypothetical protein
LHPERIRWLHFGGLCQNVDLWSYFLPPRVYKWVSGNPKTGIAV